MAIDVALLKELCEAPGVPGHEERIREIVIRELTPLTDEISVDALGNVVGLKRGTEGGRLMLSGHMDEIGFMVSYVEEHGYLHFVPLGGFDPKTLTAQRVVVHGREDLAGVMGSKPIHIMTDDEKKKPLKLEDYFIDLGLPGDRVRELVRPGDVVTREREVVRLGDTLCGKSFDDRVGVFVMLEGLRAAAGSKMDVYAVASVQEEIGLRGATVAARNVDPHVGLALDVTLANDGPFAKPHEYVSRLGDGVAIKAFDSSVVPNWKLRDFMRELCEARGIPYQLEILPRGGTDTAAIQRSGSGAAAGCVSVPTRYVHSVVEMVHPDDVEASIRLTSALIESCEKDQFAF